MTKKFKTGKRVLSLFLAALLVVTMLPTSLLTALADTATDTDADAVSVASEDDGEEETTTLTSESGDSDDADTATSEDDGEEETSVTGSDEESEADTETAESTEETGSSYDTLYGSGWWTDTQTSTAQSIADGETVTFYVLVWSDSMGDGEYAAFCVEATDGNNYFTGTSDGDCWGAGDNGDAADTDAGSGYVYVGSSYIVTISRSGNNFTADIINYLTGESILEYPMYLEGTAEFGDTACYIMSQEGNLYVSAEEDCFSAEVARISEDTFPDENFRNYISENIDRDGNGILTQREVLLTSSMDVSYRGISNMTGLSYFTNLTNLNVSYNYLAELDVTALTNLTVLYCNSNSDGNFLTSIDLSQNTKLEYLSMVYDGTEENPHGSLTELNVSGLSSLWYLDFAWQSVSSLNLSGCTSLTHLDPGGNYLTELDVTDCTALEELYAGENDLEALDVSQNGNLRILQVFGSELTELDLSNNTELTELNVSENRLTELDLTNNTALTSVDCSNNALTTLDLTNSTELNYLQCDNNSLTELDLTNNTALTSVYCNNNCLTELNLPDSTELTYIECGSNNLTELDVSGLTNLTSLYCGYNALTALDCSGLSNLVNLYCHENQIADLNVTGCYSLELLENGGGCVTEIDLSDCTNLITLSLGTNQLTSVDLSNNTKLQTLYLDTNTDLTEVNLSMLTELQYLDIYNTGITSLDVSNLSGSLWHVNASNNGSLTRIDAQGNALTELDVSGCIALTYLDASYNNLESLYLLDCTALSELHVNNNRLTSLNLAGLTELTQDMVWCYDNYYLITVTSGDGSWYLYDINFGQTGINPGAISNLSGATQDEEDNWILYIDEDADTVTYTYDTENPNGIYLDFALTVEVGSLEINEENFSDENFRNYIYEAVDTNGNGWLSESEIAAVTYMDVSWRGISDMTGLSYFTNLEYLDVSCNNIWELDVTALVNLKTLRCTSNEAGNFISSIDLSQNTALESLTMNYESSYGELGPLTELDLSGHTALTDLDITFQSFSSLDLTGCTGLFGINVQGCYNLESLNLSDQTELDYLIICQTNLTSIDLSQNTKLTTLDAWQSQLTSLDVSNLTELTFLNVNGDQLTELDVTNNTALTYLDVSGNQLTELDVTNNTALTDLYAANNQLTNLNVANCTALTNLQVQENQLTELDVTNNTALTDLYAANNQLTELDVTNNTALTYLQANDNQLTALDVTQNAELINLYLWCNQLTEIDVTNNTELIDLHVDYNQLTTLDVSNNVNLSSLCAAGNQLTELNISMLANLGHLEVSENQLTELDVTNNTALRELYAGSNQLNSLDLSACTALEYLYAPYNSLTSLDVSGLTNLYYLDAGANALTSLNVEGCTALQTLWLATNKLSGVDLSTNTALHYLWISDNDLVTLDTTACTELEYAWVYNNPLVSFDLSGCDSFWELQGDNLIYYITADDVTDGVYDLSTLVNVYGLDLSRTYTASYAVTGSEDEEETESSIIYWDNGYVDTEALTLTFYDGCSSASYNYECGNGWTIYVTIEVGVVEINEETFPDENFRRYVSENFDWNGDGTLSRNEIEGATSIDAQWWWIYDLTGIEYLTELTYINVSNNPISVLDLTANTKLEEVYCNYNWDCWDGTMTVNVSELTNLWTLDVSCSNVTELNVSGCTALQYIYCNDNQMTELDISGLVSLQDIWTQNSGLTSMNASGCTSLFMLDCYDNQLTSLNVSGCTALEILSAWNNQLTTVDISDCTALTELNINDNALTGIDLSNNTSLVSVNVGNNDLTSLDVSMLSNLNYLYCYSNNLMSVDVTNLYNLADLNIDDNYIMISASDLSVDEDGNEYLDLTTLEAYGFDLSRIGDIWCETDGWIDYDWESIVYIHDNAGRIAYSYHCGDCDNNVNGDDYWRDFRIYITVPVNFDLNYDTEETMDSLVAVRNSGIQGDVTSPEREHYTFTGWYTSADDEADGFDFGYVTESATAYAHWDIDTYPVSYDYNYSDGEDLDYTDYIGWNETAVEPETPVREGYEFGGWYDRSTSQAYDFSTPVTGDVSLYARWTLKTYTVTYDANGGTLASDDAASQTLKYGSTASEPVSPTRDTWTFLGWFTGTGDDAEEYDFSQPVTEDITLYAHWTLKTWTVSFDPNYSGADEIADQIVSNGATAEEPIGIVRTGYTYTWYIYGTSTEYDFSTPVTADVELYAKWTRTTHTVTFDANGGTLNDSETVSVKHNAAIAEPADPTRTGYIFAGWYTEDGEAYDFDTLVTANITLTAKWAVKTYTVTWDTNGGTMNVDGESVTYITAVAKWGRTLEEPEEDPTRDGYTFTGWYVVGTVDLYDFDTLVTGEVHLYAGWSRNTYTVTFDANGGSNAPGAQTVKYGSRATEPTDPTYSGYTFDGWYTEDGTLFDFDTTLITEDITLYAQWTSDGGKTEEPIVITKQPESMTVEAGETVTLSVAAEGEGLTYLWYYMKAGATEWSAWTTRTEATMSAGTNTTWDGIQIRCIITDAYGNTATSDIATITIGTETSEIVITSQPESVTVEAGETVTLSVTAEGEGLTYLWYYKKAGATEWSAWTTRTESTMSAVANATWDGMQICCVITDAYGNTTTSDFAMITIGTPASEIVITSQPESMTVEAGETVTLSVTAEGDSLTYLWYYMKADATEWSAWTTRTESTMSAVANATWDGMQIRCIITDAYGNTAISDAAMITIGTANESGPVITGQPESVTVSANTTVSFSVTAEGDNLTYQWYYMKSGATEWTLWSGRTAATMTATANTSWNGMQVYCLVTDSNGNSVASEIATITISD